MHTFFVSTDRRDRTKYPNASDFVYDLPITLNQVTAFAVRDFKFKRETLINANNQKLAINYNGTSITATLQKGDYSNDITSLLNALNAALSAANVPIAFTVNGAGIVTCTASDPPHQDYYVVIQATSLLRILGYMPNTGICLLKGSATAPTGLASNIIISANPFVAPNPYDTWTFADMVMRITDIETILSPDPVTNRCSAVLFHTCTDGTMCKQALDHKIPLLQTQSRLQRLHIRLLNTDGDLYDNSTFEAMFLLEFYCKKPCA